MQPLSEARHQPLQRRTLAPENIRVWGVKRLFSLELGSGYNNTCPTRQPSPERRFHSRFSATLLLVANLPEGCGNLSRQWWTPSLDPSPSTAEPKAPWWRGAAGSSSSERDCAQVRCSIQVCNMEMIVAVLAGSFACLSREWIGLSKLMTAASASSNKRGRRS